MSDTKAGMPDETIAAEAREITARVLEQEELRRATLARAETLPAGQMPSGMDREYDD